MAGMYHTEEAKRNTDFFRRKRLAGGWVLRETGCPAVEIARDARTVRKNPF